MSIKETTDYSKMEKNKTAPASCTAIIVATSVTYEQEILHTKQKLSFYD